MKRKLFVMLMTLCLLCSFTLCAGAAGFYGDNASGDLNGSAFVSGYGVTNDANIDGIAFLAGENIRSTGSAEYMAAAARTVSIIGNVEKDSFLAGQDISIQGHTGRDLFAAGQTLDIIGDVDGNVYGAAQAILIQGKVQGDAYLSAEKIFIGKDAVIGGTLHYPSTADITANADILQRAVVEQVQEEETHQDNPDMGRKALEKLGSFVGLAIVTLVLLWLTPLWETVDSRYTGKPFSKYAIAFGIGFAAFVGVPLAAILLMISNVGMRLAALLLMVYAAALVVSCGFAAFFAGSLLWRKAMKKAPKLWLELILGTALWTVASCIPVVSFLLGFVAMPFGLGVVTLLITDSKAAKPTDPIQVPQLPEGDSAAE